MRICLILEGSYPYVHGGVSTWMHAYIQAMQEHEFVLWVIGAKAEGRGKFVYDLPSNVVEVEEVFLDDALRLHGEHVPVLFTEEERTALRELLRLGTAARNAGLGRAVPAVSAEKGASSLLFAEPGVYETVYRYLLGGISLCPLC